MKNIGVIPNFSKDPGGVQTSSIVSKIEQKGMQPIVLPEVYQVIKAGKVVEKEDFYSMSDFIFVLGGDGTLLRAARQACKYGLPILGINMGRLGFLTEVEVSDIDGALDSLLSGDYYIERRMMLKAKLVRQGMEAYELVALNDIAIAKASFARIIHLKVFINGEFVGYYPADGILVSSPTGSTAYSLSAGGPIINPGMECLLLTPICPHALSARAIVTDSKDEINIVVADKSRDVLLTVDGQEGVPVYKGDNIVITKAEVETRLVRIRRRSFFNLLRDKMAERLSDLPEAGGGGREE
ncbi:MAG: NAD(+)/NADH kinase [Caldicoprobacter oshimai]|uniref:NAD kinase n=1 Tax=Caldicoprobacter faecalis TaxID=937334 RepID=A0A1I5U8G8_9FIRM|nr:NAD(+)/NADH kinase [Caldicoprobacter faecalis]SFP91555.1 NAD+ kinase [Caldicoprobacter faecalis]